MSLRLPVELKDKLVKVAAQRMRDSSSLLIEYAAKGVREDERQLRSELNA